MHKLLNKFELSFRLGLVGYTAMALMWCPPTSAQETEPAANEDPVVAIVGTQPILESYVQRTIRELTLGDQIDVRSRQDEFLNSIIREEVLFQYALSNLGKNPQWRDELKAAVVQKLIESEVRSNTEVSDEEAREYYLATKPNLGGEHITLYDIRFADRTTCDAQYDSIKTLDDFKQAAKQYHADPELAELEGEVGFLMTRHIAFGYGPQLDGLAENTPHKIMNGVDCHIVWLTDRETLPVPSFDELRERLKAGLQQGAQSEKLQALLARAEGSVGVTRIGDEQIQAGEQVDSEPEISNTPAPFKLVNHKNETVDQSLFNGRYHVVMFGFTHCPEVCPTTLFEMSYWQTALGEAAKDIVFAFVSVDPERDTPEILNTYVNAFSESITGLTGSPEEVANLMSRFDIKVQRVPLSDGGYTMDHTSSVFLVDQTGEIRDTIAFREDNDSAIRKLNDLLGNAADKSASLTE